MPNLLCKEYKNKGRLYVEYRGFRLPSLKLILEYSFPGFVMKIERNKDLMQFDIYMCMRKANREKIDMVEVERFRKFYGYGFNLILLAVEDTD